MDGGFLFKLVIGGALLALGAWRAYQTNKALTEDLDDGRCVACDSTDLQFIASGAYRCSACGYEGGSGRKAIDADKRKRAVAALDPGVRRTNGAKLLLEARTLLLAVQGTSKHLVSVSRRDMVGMSTYGAAEAKQAEMVSATSELLRAQGCLADAALHLGEGAVAPGEVAIDFSATAFFLDKNIDTLIGDLMVHQRIKKIDETARTMLEATEDALMRLGIPFARD